IRSHQLLDRHAELQPNPEQVFTRLHGVRADTAAAAAGRRYRLATGDDQSLPRVNAVRAFKVSGLYDGLHTDTVAQGDLAQRFTPGDDVSCRVGLSVSGRGSKQEHCQQKQQNASAQQRIGPPDIDPVLTVHYDPLTSTVADRVVAQRAVGRAPTLRLMLLII